MEANPIVLDDTAGDVVVVVVEGEHDIYTAPTLRERLDEALDRGGGVVVDLTAATFVLAAAIASSLRRTTGSTGTRPVMSRIRCTPGSTSSPTHTTKP